MKNPHIVYPSIIGLVIVLLSLILFGQGDAAVAKKELDPGAQVLIDQAEQVSKQFQSLDEEANPLRERLAKIDAEQSRLRQGNAGRDLTLCAQYGLKYIRGSDGKSGTVEEVDPANCSF